MFDSTTAPATRQALYVQAAAERVDTPAPSPTESRGCSPRASVDQGLGELAIDEVTNGAGFRLYHTARAHSDWILDADHDVRVRVQP